MIRFLTDENFNGKILRAIRRANPDADILRVQDSSVYQATDPQVLEWATQEGRILLTHDIKTMVGFANARLEAGLPMAGVIAVRLTLPFSQVIDNLLLILGASEPSEWENRIVFLPL
jgi:predicted nuclease of predicted toxin-antitoxin system